MVTTSPARMRSLPIAVLLVFAMVGCKAERAQRPQGGEASVKALTGSWEWIGSSGGTVAQSITAAPGAFTMTFGPDLDYRESGDSVTPLETSYDTLQLPVVALGGKRVAVIRLHHTNFFTRFSPDSILAPRLTGDTLELVTVETNAWHHRFIREK